MESLTYDEMLATTSEVHLKLVKSLEKLTGIEGFPGCEVSGYIWSRMFVSLRQCV